MNFADFPQPGSWKFRQINNELVSAGETKILSNQISRNKIGQSNQANQPKQRNHSHHLNMATPSRLKRKGASPRFVFFIFFNLSHLKHFIWVKYPYLSLGLPARPPGYHFKPFQLSLITFQPKPLTSKLLLRTINISQRQNVARQKTRHARNSSDTGSDDVRVELAQQVELPAPIGQGRIIGPLLPQPFANLLADNQSGDVI
jgi:hypothetical protein